MFIVQSGHQPEIWRVQNDYDSAITKTLGHDESNWNTVLVKLKSIFLSQ